MTELCDVRRVVVGSDDAGKSVIVSDGPAPNGHDFAALPGQSQVRIWFTDGPPTTAVPGTEPTDNTGPVVPGVGGAGFVIVRVAPDSVAQGSAFDPAAAAAEFEEFAPDIAAASDPSDAGMHRTQSVDYVVVISGELWLEVDGGERTLLRPGDTVVQIAGRHAWRNTAEDPATIAVVLTGAAAA